MFQFMMNSVFFLAGTLAILLALLAIVMFIGLFVKAAAESERKGRDKP